jgi:hypothetical protein
MKNKTLFADKMIADVRNPIISTDRAVQRAIFYALATNLKM